MGTISQKLEYLNTTKGKIKDSINLTGANIGSNDTFRSYAVKLRDGLVNVLNNGTIVLYNNFPKVSGTGSNISLSNTLEAPMFMNKFDGDTLQNGTPTPSTPVEIQSVEGIQNVSVCGKNLFDKYTIYIENKLIQSDGSLTNTQNYDLYKTYVNEETNYTLSITNIGNTTRDCRICAFKNDNTFISAVSNFNISANSSANATFIIPNDTAYILYHILKTNDEVQLEKGNQPTTYEAYTGDSYEVNLGQNLLNIPDGTYESLQDSTKTITFVNGVGTPNFTTLSSAINVNIPIPTVTLEAGTYTMNDFTNQNYPYFQLKNENTNIINTAYGDNGKKTFTLLENKIINNISLYYGSTSATYGEIKPQLEIGNGSNQFYPYISPIKLCKIGTYQDYIYKNGENWYKHKEIAKIKLSSTLNWFRDKEKPNSWRFYSQSDVIPNSHNNEAMSNYFKGDTIANVNNIDSQAITTINYNQIALRINKSIASTVDDLKTWLSNNEVYDYTILTTPTTEQITDTYLISQLNALYNAKSYDGQTNISVSGNLPMILEVSALKDEI